MTDLRYADLIRNRINRYTNVQYLSFFILLVNAIISLSLRIYHIEIWARFTYDEAWSYEVANFINENGFYGCYTCILNQPPLNAFINALIFNLFGTHPFIGRVFASVVIVGFILICSRIAFLVSKRNYVIMAIVSTFLSYNTALIEVSKRMDMISMTLLIGSITLLQTLKFLNKPNRRSCINLGITIGLLMLTKWSLVFMPISIGIFYLLYKIVFPKQKNQVLSSLGYYDASFVVIISALMLLPFIIYMGVIGELLLTFSFHSSKLGFSFLSFTEIFVRDFPFIIAIAMVGMILQFLQRDLISIFSFLLIIIGLPFLYMMPAYNDFILFFLCILIPFSRGLSAITSDSLIKKLNPEYQLKLIKRKIRITKNTLNVYNTIFVLQLLVFSLVINSGKIFNINKIEYYDQIELEIWSLENLDPIRDIVYASKNDAVFTHCYYFDIEININITDTLSNITVMILTSWMVKNRQDLVAGQLAIGQEIEMIHFTNSTNEIIFVYTAVKIHQINNIYIYDIINSTRSI